MGKRRQQLKIDTSILERKEYKKNQPTRVLIVCEGEKTEINYFNFLSKQYQLTGIELPKNQCGSSPISILEYAKFRERKDEFDKVFCVFDKDKHETYDNTIKELQKLSKENPDVWKNALINSVPCFEYWYLLHFEYTTKPFNPLIKNKKGGSSEQVISELKKYIPDYEKSNRNMFQQLVEKLPFAIKNAEKSLAEAEKNQTDNPTTKVHLLVEYLQQLKK